ERLHVLVPVLTAFTVRSAKVTDKGALAHETTTVVEPCVESLAGALHAPRPRHMTASSAGAVLEFVVTSIKTLVTTQTLRTPFTTPAAIRYRFLLSQITWRKNVAHLSTEDIQVPG